MLKSLLSLFVNRGGGLTETDIDNFVRRDRFSDFLNYISYDPETNCYVNQDESFGFVWECIPMTFHFNPEAESIEGLLKNAFPANAVLQWNIYADDYIEPILDEITQLRSARSTELTQTTTQELVNFLRNGINGLKKNSGTPIRNFRIFVSLKMPVTCDQAENNTWSELQRAVKSSLDGIGLCPVVVDPPRLLGFMRRLFNDEVDPGTAEYWDDEMPLRKQVIKAETEITDEGGGVMKIGERYWKCLSPKEQPRTVNPLQTNNLFGGIWGKESDAHQIKSPFLYSLNIIFQPLKARLHTKCSMVLKQEAVGSFAPTLRRKQEEYLRAVEMIEDGMPFVRIVPALWIINRDKGRLAEAYSVAKRIWEDQNYTMQEERFMTKVMLLSSFPMGLYINKKMLDDLDRDFIVDVRAASAVVPVSCDFSGGSTPSMVFVGRKGQLIQFSLFAKNAINSNFMVTAGSGGGKSFFCNYLLINNYLAGALCRVIDIGGSYQKLAEMLPNSKYLEFSPEVDICLNPFTNVKADAGKNEDPFIFLRVINAVVAQMAYASTEGEMPGPIENQLISEAVKWAWMRKGTSADIDTIYEFFLNFPAVDGVDYAQLGDNKEFIQLSQKLALLIRDFTSNGPFGRYFNGVSNFDISKDDFCVLELEHLKQQKELFKVITLQVINAVTQDLYLSDRSKRRIVLLDEAWMFLGEGALLKAVVEEGYRRARKYGGSFGIVVQSVMDIESFGQVGAVVNSNSAYKIYLKSGDFAKAKAAKAINYDDFTVALMEKIDTVKPNYGEIFIDSPVGRGVARLIVDDFGYYVYTSEATEAAEIREMVKGGKTYVEAIWAMVKKYRR